MSDLMREEFEKEWGQTNEEQGLRFVAELNLYGCDLYLNSGMADRKSSAWFYFQKGWQASRECLVIDLEPDDPADEGAAYLHQDFVKERIQSLELKVKP